MNEKEAAIQKINKIGKIGKIISKIARIFLSIGVVFTIVGFVACLVLPRDLAKVKIDGKAVVDVNISEYKTLSEKEQQNLRDNFKKSKDENKLYLRDNNYSIQDYSVNEDGFELICDADMKTIDMRDIAKICFLGTIYLAISIASVIFLGRLCKSLEICQSPFDADVIDKMQQFSFALIPWAFVSSFSKVVISAIFTSDLNFTFGINFGVVTIVLIILALTYIFKYGAMLQQESDETL